MERQIVMDVAFILDKYFKGTRNVSIDVFDAQTLNAVYRDVVNAMTSHFEIEVSVLQERMNSVTIDTVKKAKHVGILNACLRIKMMFRDQAKFAIESEKGIGMSVIITIPLDLITKSE